MHDRGVSAAEVVMTVLHAGGKFDHSSYKVSAGLHGVGVSAVNAVSEWLTLEIRREGKLWRQLYKQGVPQAPLAPVEDTLDTGTTITFKPDATIFSSTEYHYDILANRLRELAFLNQGLVIDLEDLRHDEGETATYEYQGGIKEFVALLTQAKEPITDDVIAFQAAMPLGEGSADMLLDIAMQWTSTFTEQ